jgi:hypothetical protein
VFDFVPVELSELGIHVTAGEVLALAMRNPANQQSSWLFAWGDRYACGSSFWRGAAVRRDWSAGVTTELGFRTYVDGVAAADALCGAAPGAEEPGAPSSIAEPSTLATAGAALLAFGTVRRRRGARRRAPALRDSAADPECAFGRGDAAAAGGHHADRAERPQTAFDDREREGRSRCPTVGSERVGGARCAALAHTAHDGRRAWQRVRADAQGDRAGVAEHGEAEREGRADRLARVSTAGDWS